MMECKICGKTFQNNVAFFEHLKYSHPLSDEYACINKDCFRKMKPIEAFKKHFLCCEKKKLITTSIKIINR